MSMAAHKHAGVIKAWADGAQIECLTSAGWQAIGESPSWGEFNEYRVKPAEPERVYPVTQMSIAELLTIWANVSAIGTIGPALQETVNRAIRRCCDAGQVVIREEFDRAVADRRARDLAVAKHVINTFLCTGKAMDTDECLLKIIDEVGK
jgi:hypothetical protein